MFKVTSLAVLAMLLIVLLIIFLTAGYVGTEEWGVIAPIIAIGMSLVLLFVVLYTSARYNTWVTFVREGTMKIVTANGVFVKCILRQKGFFFNEATRKVEPATDGEDRVSRFTQLTGLFLVSPIFPLQQVYEFKILKVRLQKGRDKMDNIRQKIDRDSKKTTVDYLLYKIDRPFLLLDVDLSDGTRVHILGKGVYHVYDPIRMIFELNAEFFDNLDTLVKAYIINKYRTISIDDLRQKSESQVTPTELKVAYDVKTIVGLDPESLVVEEWSLSEKDKALQDALEAKNIAEKQGDALIATANKAGQAKVKTSEYNKTARYLDGDAEGGFEERKRKGVAAGESALISTFRNQGVTPDGIVRIKSMEQIKELTGTYFEGGSGIQPVAAVNINPKSSQPVTPAPQTEMVTVPATTGPRPRPQQPAPHTSSKPGANFGKGKKKRVWDEQPPQN